MDCFRRVSDASDRMGETTRIFCQCITQSAVKRQSPHSVARAQETVEAGILPAAGSCGNRVRPRAGTGMQHALRDDGSTATVTAPF